MKRPLRTGRSLPPITGRDITRKFLTCVERHREQCQKSISSKPRHEQSRSPSGSSGTGSADNPLDIVSSELRENIEIVNGQIRELEREVASGLSSKKFDSLAESIHESIRQNNEDMEYFETLCTERRRQGSSSDNKRYLQRMSNTMSNQIKSSAKKFKNLLMKHQEQISQSEKRLSSNRVGGRSGLRQRRVRRARDARERLLNRSQQNEYSQEQSATQELQHRQRNLQISKWASMIQEISSMMTQMTEQLADQGHMLTRIEENVFDVNTNVSEGHGYLLDYLQGIQGNRSLIIKIFIFLICSLFFFVYFLRG